MSNLYNHENPGIAFISVFGTVIGIVAMVVFIIYQLNVETAFTRKLIAKGVSIRNRIVKRNWLYQCKRCDRYQRRYQLDFWKIKEGNKECVHCLSFFSSSYRDEYENRIANPDAWTDTHKDCFKLSIRDYIKLRKAVVKVRDFKMAERVEERLNEYNKISKDSEWMQRLQKVKAHE